jgi:hypothetical protein
MFFTVHPYALNRTPTVLPKESKQVAQLYLLFETATRHAIKLYAIQRRHHLQLL